MRRRHIQKDNILLVNITRLGDMLQSTPTIAGMKLENPDCKVTVLVEKQFQDVCSLVPNIDEVIGLDLGMTVRSLAREGEGILDAFDYITEVVEDLRHRNYDYCLNMSSSAYTALLIKLVGIQRNGGWVSDEEGYRVIESEWARLFATSVFHRNREFNSLNLVDVFRCSADVDQHPEKLLINVDADAQMEVREMIAQANFSNTGPLIAIQAGASQAKRQWSPRKFADLIKILVEREGCRVVLTGTKKELNIIEPIVNAVGSNNVMVAAGRTSIAQLTALLNEVDLLITGDTGPMHMSVAVGTPVVAMFLASAYGFETGPYSADNIIIQPVIGCGPCNPNKGCARPDCHENVTPEMVAKLAILRLNGRLSPKDLEFVDANQAIIYRTFFDELGFYDLEALTDTGSDRNLAFRQAYRKLWLEDIGGLSYPRLGTPEPRKASLNVLSEAVEGLPEVLDRAKTGVGLIDELLKLVKDITAPTAGLKAINFALSNLDREIEELGYHYPHLGPVTRMFVFSKEHIAGTEVASLASQMRGIYLDLSRRCEKLEYYYQLNS